VVVVVGMRGRWLLALWWVVGGAMASPHVQVGGQVLLERAGRVQPLEGVAVSDGRQIVHTDAQGRYRMHVEPGRHVFVIKPAGLQLPLAEDGQPRFWARAHAATQPLDFRLLPAQPSQQTRVLLFADPQVGSERQLGYFQRSVVEPLGRPEAAFGMTLGDLVDDQPGLYPALNAAIARLGLPWFNLPGNHDIDPGADDDLSSLSRWSAVYGPDTYAVEEGAAAFVFLDDVVVRPGGGYVGGLREDQFQFLQAYLASLPAQRLLVLAMHIPVFDKPGRETFRAADRRRLFELLRDHPSVLLLSAHNHQQQHYWHGAADGWNGAAPLHEFNLGAVCGAFWSGVDDAAGVPVSMMDDGTPRGWGQLTVLADGQYRLQYTPSVRGERPDPAQTASMALHAPAVLRRGAYPAWGVYANVFMGHAGSRVEYRVDDGPWQPMRRVERADPRLLLENAADDLAPSLRSYDRSAEAVASSHLWRGALPTGLAAGAHQVQVRVLDAQGAQDGAVARIGYRLEDAEH
jgi:hypothetical protein